MKFEIINSPRKIIFDLNGEIKLLDKREKNFYVEYCDNSKERIGTIYINIQSKYNTTDVIILREVEDMNDIYYMYAVERGETKDPTFYSTFINSIEASCKTGGIRIDCHVNRPTP